MLISDSESLCGKSIIVTGATGAIGQSIVDAILKCGATVFAQGRDEAKLAILKETQGPDCIPLCYDVTDEKSVSQAFRNIKRNQSEGKAGPLYGLVNNAGIMQVSSLLTTPLDTLRKHLDTNLISAFQHMQLASRLMAREKRGSIVNIVSQAGELGSEGLSAYAASKSGLTGATKSIAKELAPTGIRVNAVSPGFIDTTLVESFDEKSRSEILSRIRWGSAGKPQDVACAVMYFLSPGSAYVSGQVLAVDGIFSP